jgi:hypothetical protein
MRATAALLTTEKVMHEAIASAYGNRQPETRQYERDEMGAASISRTRSRMTWTERDALRRRMEDVIRGLEGLQGDALARAIVDALLAGDGGE